MIRKMVIGCRSIVLFCTFLVVFTVVAGESYFISKADEMKKNIVDKRNFRIIFST